MIRPHAAPSHARALGSPAGALLLAALAISLAPRVAAQAPAEGEAAALTPASEGDAEAITASDPVTEARQLFEAGVALTLEERWSEALPIFERSRALVERPSTVFNIGVCLQRVGRLVEALAVFEAFLALADPEHDAAKIEEARAALAMTRGSVAELVLEVSPPSARVEVDGTEMPGAGSPRAVRLDPGARHVRVTLDGYVAEVFELAAASGERVARRVALVEAEREVEIRERVVRVGRPIDPAPWALFGVGASSVAAGVVMIAIGESSAATVESAGRGTTWSSISGAYDAAIALRVAGPIALGVGLAAAAVGVAWHLVLDAGGDPAAESQHVTLTIGVGSVSVAGSL